METISTVTRDNIFSRVSEKNSYPMTVKTGQGVLKRGTVMISLAADTGEHRILLSTDTPDATDKLSIRVLAEGIDATSAAVETTGYRSGNYVGDELTFGGSDTSADWINDLRNVNIILDLAAKNSLAD